MNILSNTLRNEIAECLQKAYKKVSINSATKMLNFNTTNEMNDFANKVNLSYKIKFSVIKCTFFLYILEKVDFGPRWVLRISS